MFWIPALRSIQKKYSKQLRRCEYSSKRYHYMLSATQFLIEFACCLTKEMKIKYYKNGIYYCSQPKNNLPIKIDVNGVQYYRFHGFIYTSTELENLQPEQVIAVNDLRNKYFEFIEENHVNRYVKNLFKKMIGNSSAHSVLEIGAGYSPLFEDNPAHLDFMVADINPSSMRNCGLRGLKSITIAKDGVLPISENSIDLIIAIFVFQFNISHKLVAEFSRVLQFNGIIVANVYRRAKSSREKLLALFSQEGFSYKIFRDSTCCCREHEYWCIYKNLYSEIREAIVRFFENNK